MDREWEAEEEGGFKLDIENAGEEGMGRGKRSREGRIDIADSKRRGGEDGESEVEDGGSIENP